MCKHPDSFIPKLHNSDEKKHSKEINLNKSMQFFSLSRCEFILIYLFECFNSKSEQIVSKSCLEACLQADFGNYWFKELAPKALKVFIFFYLHVKDHVGKFSY